MDKMKNGKFELIIEPATFENFKVGTTYRTKILDWKFKLTRDPYVYDQGGCIVGIKNTAYGIYEDAPHLGECPLSTERILREPKIH